MRMLVFLAVSRRINWIPSAQNLGHWVAAGLGSSGGQATCWKTRLMVQVFQAVRGRTQRFVPLEAEGQGSESCCWWKAWPWCRECPETPKHCPELSLDLGEGTSVSVAAESSFLTAERPTASPVTALLVDQSCAGGLWLPVEGEASIPSGIGGWWGDSLSFPPLK